MVKLTPITPRAGYFRCRNGMIAEILTIKENIMRGVIFSSDMKSKESGIFSWYQDGKILNNGDGLDLSEFIEYYSIEHIKSVPPLCFYDRFDLSKDGDGYIIRCGNDSVTIKGDPDFDELSITCFQLSRLVESRLA